MEETAVKSARDGIVFYDHPLETDRYQFLYDHLDCDSIVQINEDANNRTIHVIARAMKKEYNRALEDFFYSEDYSGKYAIMQGIDSREVNRID